MSLLRFFFAPTRSRVWQLLAIIAGIGALVYFGYWAQVKTLLSHDAMRWQIWNAEFTLYDILQGVVALIFIGWTAGYAAHSGAQKIHQLKELTPQRRTILVRIVQLAIYFIAALLALQILRIDITVIAVLGGAIGVGIGFGLQKIAANFISGLILLFENTIREGDIIELDGLTGVVQRAHLRYTVLRTFDGREALLPNEDLITGRVINLTYSDRHGRMTLRIQVAHGSDYRRAHDIILATAKDHPDIMDDPAPFCFLDSLGDNGVQFCLFAWVSDIAKGTLKVQSELYVDITKRLADAKIAIPFPQQDIHIKSNISKSV